MKNYLISALLFSLLVSVSCGPKIQAPAGSELDPASYEKWDTARAEQYLTQNPGSRRAHVLYLKNLQEDKDVDEEIIKNQRIIINAFNGMFPQDSPSYFHDTATWLNHQAWYLITHDKKFKLAEALVQESLKRREDECDFLDTLAELQYRRGEHEKALTNIRLALEQTTDRGRPMNRSKRRYLQKQRAKFEKAYKQNPEDSSH